MPFTILSATELVQLAALGPCLFVFLYLLLTTRDWRVMLVPLGFFASLFLTFLLPIMAHFPVGENLTFTWLIRLNNSLLPTMAFLLVCQFAKGKPLELSYAAFLMLPLGSLIFVYYDDVNSLRLYRVLTLSVLFALLVPVLGRVAHHKKGDVLSRHKYWLMVMLVFMNLAGFATDLAFMAGRIDGTDHQFARAMFNVAFIYLVLTSVFRVFYRDLGIKALSHRHFTERDKHIAEHIRTIISVEKPYHESDFTRSVLADRMGLTEQHLSRIINRAFGKSFTSVMNEQRIEEAKRLLVESAMPITDISFEVGFTSIASFNRVFKYYTELSPRDYRKTYKVKQEKRTVKKAA